MSKEFKKRKALVLDELIRGTPGTGNLELIRRKVNREAKKQIDMMITNINTRDDLGADTAVKALSTLKSLYLMDFEIELDEKKQIRVKRWFEVSK